MAALPVPCLPLSLRHKAGPAAGHTSPWGHAAICQMLFLHLDYIFLLQLI